jgi:hypothetical protein
MRGDYKACGEDKNIYFVLAFNIMLQNVGLLLMLLLR